MTSMTRIAKNNYLISLLQEIDKTTEEFSQISQKGKYWFRDDTYLL